MLRSELRIALVLFGLLTLLTGVAYPALVTGVAVVAFPVQAGGSIVMSQGRPVGSALLGQAYTTAGYFQGRPSATVAGPYDGGASAGSNLAPTSPLLAESVAGRIAALRAAERGGAAPVPVDLVTASGSGLDPHISPAAALYQVRRVAHARGLEESRVRDLVERRVEDRSFGLLGEPRVNVLLLNLALDRLAGER